ncbi:MAG: trypsin-like peptidase domain-containing protein [Clostridia bacterium]|nr:trypsin-like peptidase domain-containing protein [Clostridia bacterium]
MTDEFNNIPNIPENENSDVTEQPIQDIPVVEAEPVTEQPLEEIPTVTAEPVTESPVEEIPTATAEPVQQYDYSNPYATQNFDTSAFHNYYQPAAKQEDHRSSKKGLRVFCLLLAAVVLISGACTVGYLAGKNFDLNNLPDPSTPDNTQGNNVLTPDKIELVEGKIPTADSIKPDANGKYTADQVAKLVSPSVVSINVYSEDSEGTSVASGVILDKNGYVLSNDHIYSEIPNAKFVVTLSDGRSYKAVYVAGDQKSDLCVIKMIDAKNLSPASFGDSDKIASGEDVIAIGSPHGFSNTVTKGIISTPARRISFTGSDNYSFSMKVIQTDTAINFGSSGGALVNMYGQVVGINSSKIVLDAYEGICFAIPSNTAKTISKELVENKKVVGRARLGITYNEIDNVTALVNDIPSGLRLQGISIDSELNNSGLQNNDIITEIDGKKITTADIALDIIDSKKAGEKITLKVYIARTGTYRTVTTTLLQDNSVSSYTTKVEKTTGFNPFNQ